MMIIRWNKKNVMLGTKFTTAKFNQKLSHIPVYNSTLQLTLLSRFMVTIIRATLESIARLCYLRYLFTYLLGIVFLVSVGWPT